MEFRRWVGVWVLAWTLSWSFGVVGALSRVRCSGAGLELDHGNWRVGIGVWASPWILSWSFGALEPC
ncbi:hypothetical protein QBC39DRAFT_362242, partial [Podospora conica]